MRPRALSCALVHFHVPSCNAVQFRAPVCPPKEEGGYYYRVFLLVT
jgi:hypothetical protein